MKEPRIIESSKEIEKVNTNGKGVYKADITKELLEEMYWEKGMSTTKIAKKLDCSHGTVCYKMKKFDIKARSISESKTKYTINKEQLNKLYWEKKMSRREIAKELSCDDSTVWRKLKEFGIKVRSKSEAKRDETVWDAEWSDYQKEVLDGLMLGDGGVYINEGCISAYYSQGCKHKEFLKYVVDVFPSIFGENNPRIAGEGWIVQSKVNEFLTEQRHRWYPKGVKEIPEDLVVTPTVLLYWYLGDGNLSTYGDYVSIGCISLYDRLDIVIPQLKELGIPVNKQKRWIYIPKKSNDRFFEVIGEKPPVECYTYKWPSKYLTSEEMVLGYKYKRDLL